jgi:hypothetical protein
MVTGVTDGQEKAMAIQLLDVRANRDMVDGFEMGVTRTAMWMPSMGDVGRFTVQWSYALPRPSPRHKPRFVRSSNDCDSMAEARAYLAARTKYHEGKPDFQIEIIDKADR